MNRTLIFSISFVLVLTTDEATAEGASAPFAERAIELIARDDYRQRVAGLTGLMLTLGQFGTTGQATETSFATLEARSTLQALRNSSTEDERALAVAVLEEYDSQIGRTRTSGTWTTLTAASGQINSEIPNNTSLWLTSATDQGSAELVLKGSCPAEFTFFSKNDIPKYSSGLSYHTQLTSTQPGRLRVRGTKECPGPLRLQGAYLTDQSPLHLPMASGKVVLQAGNRYNVQWEEDSALSANMAVQAGLRYHVMTLNSSEGTDTLIEVKSPGMDLIADDDSGFAPLDSMLSFTAWGSGEADLTLKNLKGATGSTELVIWAEQPKHISPGEWPVWVQGSQIFLLPTEPDTRYEIETIGLAEGVDPVLWAGFGDSQITAMDDDGGQEDLAAKIVVEGSGLPLIIEIMQFPHMGSEGVAKLQVDQNSNKSKFNVVPASPIDGECKQNDTI